MDRHDGNYQLTLCVPCFMRPKRTLRAIECVLNQKFNGNWEAYLVGDGCDDFQKLLDDGTLEKYVEQAKENGNKLVFKNLPLHHGGWGYNARNYIFERAVGDYTLFLDNDDVILTNHFQNYYNGIVNTEYDFVYYNVWLDLKKEERVSELMFGRIGHHEIIVKTNFLKKMPKQTSEYGHDWVLIENMLKANAKHKKIRENELTYYVMGIGDLRQDEID